MRASGAHATEPAPTASQAPPRTAWKWLCVFIKALLDLLFFCFFLWATLWAIALCVSAQSPGVSSSMLLLENKLTYRTIAIISC